MVEVCLEDLDAAAKELSQAACGIGGVDTAAPVEALPGALAGSATGPAAVALAMRLTAALQVYTERVNEMAAATSGCAENYRTEDDAAAARFRALGMP